MMKQEEVVQIQEVEAKAERRAYEAPKLVEYGPLRAAIRGVGTQGHDVLNTCDPNGPVDRGC